MIFKLLEAVGGTDHFALVREQTQCCRPRCEDRHNQGCACSCWAFRPGSSDQRDCRDSSMGRRLGGLDAIEMV